jgi:hypothetical protein
MNTNTMNRQGLPQEHYTFTAIECKSIFSKGKFEQELTGKLVTDEIKASAKTRASPRTAEQIVAQQNASFEYNTTEGSEQTRMLAEQDAGFDELPPAPRPAPPPQPATSTGDLQNTPSTEFGFEVSSAPQQMNRET